MTCIPASYFTVSFISWETGITGSFGVTLLSVWPVIIDDQYF